MPSLLLHPRDLELNRPITPGFPGRFMLVVCGESIACSCQKSPHKMELWLLIAAFRLARIAKVILAADPQ